MKFIEVTEKESNRKVLIQVDKIIAIWKAREDLTAVVETHTDKFGDVYYIETTELYLEIVKQIKELA